MEATATKRTEFRYKVAPKCHGSRTVFRGDNGSSRLSAYAIKRKEITFLRSHIGDAIDITFVTTKVVQISS